MHIKRSPGRPPKGIMAHSRRILLLLDPQLVERLDRLANRRKLTRHDVMRQALQTQIDQALPPRSRRQPERQGHGEVAEPTVSQEAQRHRG